MPKLGPRIIQDYFIPKLNQRSFGKRLEWVDRSERIFKIQYKHKNTADWKVEDAAVFTEWDRLKDPQRFRPGEPEYYTLARQRLKAAIHKLVTQKILLSVPAGEDHGDKSFKYYKIMEGHKRDKKPRPVTQKRRREMAPDRKQVAAVVATSSGLPEEMRASTVDEYLQDPGDVENFQNLQLFSQKQNLQVHFGSQDGSLPVEGVSSDGYAVVIRAHLPGIVREPTYDDVSPVQNEFYELSLYPPQAPVHDFPAKDAVCDMSLTLAEQAAAAGTYGTIQPVNADHLCEFSLWNNGPCRLPTDHPRNDWGVFETPPDCQFHLFEDVSYLSSDDKFQPLD